MSYRILLCLLLFVLVLAGCVNPLPAFPFRESATSSPEDDVVISVAAEKTSIPTLSPIALETPEVDLQDLSLYQASLRSEFTGDVSTITGATRYLIQVTLHPGEPPTLTGLERVRYTNTEPVPLDVLVFRLYPNLPGYGGAMTVGDVVVDGTAVETALMKQGSALQVPLEPALAPGMSVEVTLPFSTTVPTDRSAGYDVFSFIDDVYALAGFYPTIPVFDDEGWNVEIPALYGDVTFTDVALYQVQLTVPADLRVVTSGSVVATAEHDDGTRTLLAVGGPIRDFYIAMSADYQVISQQVDGTRVNSYYLPGQEEGGAEALRYASESLHLFSQEFGAYPYTELDVVATPTSAGGIEYPGVIAIASSFYGDPDYYYFGVVVTHEMAHQWWYGLVGSDQLDEPWMDEALTNYSMYLYYEGTAGRDQANVIKEKVFKEPYRTAQREFRDREVGGPVSSFSQEDYVTIVYGKGPLFFDAVRAQVGDAAFFAALQTYLARHRYRVAYPEDLIAAFEDASGQQIDDLYRSWIEGKGE